MAGNRKCLSTDDEFRLTVAESLSARYVLCHIKKPELDVTHFSGAALNIRTRFWMPGEPFSWDGIQVENSIYVSTSRLRNRLIEHGMKVRKCGHCGLAEWLDSPIPLELHHTNGINNDNWLHNLRLLYPNCHTLTENYRGKNQTRAKG